MDSIGKKIKVVDAVVHGLALENVVAEQKRAEELKYTYDFVVSRAVSHIQKFIPWVKGRVTKKNSDPLRINGLFSLKGGDLAEELGPIKARLTSLKDHFEDEFFSTKKVVYIPRSEIQGFHATTVVKDKK